MQRLQAIDIALLKFINGCHHPLLDSVMWACSGTWLWIPLYILLVWKFYYCHKTKFFVLLIVLAVLVLITDQAGLFIKESVMRLRPSHDPAIAHSLHFVNNYLGGMYGFVSQHAANTSAVATLCTLVWHAQLKWVGLTMTIYVLLNSLSRIYLGVHYPSDIAVGMLLGACTGTIFYGFFTIIVRKLGQ